ncbi:hypothetical protein [Mycobacterium sp. 852014-52144_SCH5372336]|uniref:hypothetical protein n=1 Tax=Mycobacterium sp. 852014-52144_SCH5372336 TaxID=1834115 RepID=UPI00080043A0|nr:hypothetical protein [Mycobacterium sp. 852014-52144_SCH5372336]OBB77131.1 hypothetical protein A5759_04695 [Mycobacterium sp. 852014-52144_SCH5372336]
MASRGSDSGGAAAVFGLLILISVVITYYWVFIGIGVAIGLFFAVRGLVRREQERRLAAAREAEILAYRAERQHRWARRGDNRGIYGVEGADLMRSISVPPAAPPTETPDEGRVAAIAYTAEDLDILLRDRPTEWQLAAFVSVLVQRLEEVTPPRIRDCQLHYPTARGHYARNGREVASFVEDCLDDLSELGARLGAFMGAPALMDVLDDSNADANAVVHVANRLMDFHERFLELAERCRDASVPSAYTGLLKDCAQLLAIPLEGYRVFIDELVEIVDEMPAVVRYAPGDVDWGTVTLEIVTENALFKRIEKQVRAAAKS